MALVLLPTGSSSAQLTNDWELRAGVLTLEIHASRTAHLFHVVDQISQWSEFCHHQYIDWLQRPEDGLSEEDREALEQHAALRKARGWGGGLEQTFYTSADLDSALAQGVEAGWVTETEAAAEHRVLVRFASRVEQLMAQEAPALARFADDLTRRWSDLAPMAARLARFVECTNLMVPVYLIASPRGGGGGGFNGQRLTLEIGGAANAYPTLEHELFHALLRTQDNLIGKAAHSAPGLDAETLSEGLAYAFNPGLDSADPSDRLLSQAAAYHAQQASLKDAYPRFTLYGLALRPLLKSALSDKRTTLKTFLPRAADAWLVLTEIDKTRWVKDPSHDIYIFGLWDEEGIKSLKALLPVRRSVWGWRHLARFYAEMLNRHAKPGDDVLLLFSLDDPDARTPEEYADLLPKSWGNVESRLRQGQSVTLQGAARQMRVFLLAAPTQEKLRSEFRRLVAARALPLLASGEDHN